MNYQIEYQGIYKIGFLKDTKIFFNEKEVVYSDFYVEQRGVNIVSKLFLFIDEINIFIFVC